MNYFRDAAGNDRSNGGSSSRKGKKSNSDKPKQPQRGLGVAQLEKIRLHSQLGFHPQCSKPASFEISDGMILRPISSRVDQEDIRIEPAYSPPSSFSYTSSSTTYNASHGQQNIMMAIGELERSNTIYCQPQLSSDPRWNGSNTIFEAQHYGQPGITRHLFQVEVEDSLRKKTWNDSMGSISQNSNSSGSQELDLELRLSL